MTEPPRWSFADLVGSTGTETFFSRYWQTEPLHVARGDPGFFSGLVSRADVDRLIDTQAGRKDFVVSLIGGREGAPVRPPAARSSWTPERIRERLAEGATIRIGEVPRHLPPVRRLAMAVEAETCTDIAVNLYFTPPAARAFGAHYDNHDVFIVQIEGEKLWRLSTPPADLPLEVTFRGREEWLRQSLPYETALKTLPSCKTAQEIVLRAGDVLYVPRGHVHEVSTGDASSLHLTVAAPVVTWYEVAVTALLGAARRSRKLREALPRRWATDEARRAAAAGQAPEVIAALKEALAEEDLDDALERLADRFVHSRAPRQEDDGRQSTVGIDTELQIRPDMVWSLRSLGAELLLLFAGRSIRLPVRAESMVRYILAERRFRVAELPTHLDDESRIVLAQALFDRGLLTLTGADG